MASVTLEHVWLHDESDHSDYVALKVRGLEASPERKVQRREYAGGRTRMISTPVRKRTASFEAVRVPRADLDWLDGKLGELLMFRDPRGRVWWGFVDELPTTERIFTDEVWLSLTFRAVTFDQEV